MLTMASHASDEDMTQRRVPHDLSPLVPKDVTYDWGIKTYKYYHLFDDTINKTFFETHEEVLLWCRCANLLQTELKELGVNKAKTRIVDLCRREFKLTNTDGQFPSSLDDVISIIKDSSWYNKDMEVSHKVVYMLSYGIFRIGYNGWAQDAVNEWMCKYSITYMDPTTLAVSSQWK